MKRTNKQTVETEPYGAAATRAIAKEKARAVVALRLAAENVAAKEAEASLRFITNALGNKFTSGVAATLTPDQFAAVRDALVSYAKRGAASAFEFLRSNDHIS